MNVLNKIFTLDDVISLSSMRCIVVLVISQFSSKMGAKFQRNTIINSCGYFDWVVSCPLGSFVHPRSFGLKSHKVHFLLGNNEAGGALFLGLESYEVSDVA